MTLRTAQVFYLALCKNANFNRDYKAPHAYRGTPPRPRFSRAARRRPGLLKGLRP